MVSLKDQIMKWCTQINGKKIEIQLPQNFVEYEKNHIIANNIHYIGTWNEKINSILFNLPGKPTSSLKKVVSYKNRIPPNKECEDDTQISFGILHRKCHFHLSLKKIYPGGETNKIVNKKTNNTVKSPLTGKILQVIKKSGKIQKNETILIIESMKMENKIKAPKSGYIDKIHVNNNSQISSGEPLFTIKE